uniref:Uncharacterized protein n=1 Tax=Aegilops tauschii subsp. strangulata TaxID=200361 RepID=A0A453NMD1_AEGTS
MAASAAAQRRRADGMAMDSSLWRAGNRFVRADGVSVAPSWPTPAGVDAPPPVQHARRSMAPWPGQQGPINPRHADRKGRGRGKQKRALPMDQARRDADTAETHRVETSGAAGGPSLTVGALVPAPTGDSSLVATTPEASPDSNQAETAVTEADRASPTPGSSDPMSYRGLAVLSEVPDAQPDGPAILSGQSDVSLMPTPTAGTDAPDQPPRSHACAEEGGDVQPTCGVEVQPTCGANPATRQVEPHTPMRILQRPPAQPTINQPTTTGPPKDLPTLTGMQHGPCNSASGR